ncbi:hypothetical protein [Flagellimonas baculiformis]|nr:hypothetical protein [Muricauda sp. D6]
MKHNKNRPAKLIKVKLVWLSIFKVKVWNKVKTTKNRQILMYMG